MNNFYNQYQKMLQDAQLAVVHFVNEFGVSHPEGDGKFLVIPESIQKEINFDAQLINDRGDLLDSGYAEPLDEEAKIFIIADNLNKCIPMYRIWGNDEGDYIVDDFFNERDLEDALNNNDYSNFPEFYVQTWNKDKKEWEDTEFSNITVTDECAVMGSFTGDEFVQFCQKHIEYHSDNPSMYGNFTVSNPAYGFQWYMKFSDDFKFEITVK